MTDLVSFFPALSHRRVLVNACCAQNTAEQQGQRGGQTAALLSVCSVSPCFDDMDARRHQTATRNVDANLHRARTETYLPFGTPSDKSSLNARG
jgi:hypothetical protein